MGSHFLLCFLGEHVSLLSREAGELQHPDSDSSPPWDESLAELIVRSQDGAEGLGISSSEAVAPAALCSEGWQGAGAGAGTKRGGQSPATGKVSQ